MTSNNSYEVHVCSICGDVADTIIREGRESGYHCMRCNHIVRDCYCDDWETESFIYNGVVYEGSTCSYIDHFTCAGKEISVYEFCEALDKVKELFNQYNLNRAK